MQWYEILSAIGAPTILASAVGVIVTAFKNRKNDRKKQAEEFALMKSAEQMNLRIELLKMYKTCTAQGYASLEDRELFLACYGIYHSLGSNGVMDSVKDKFTALPIEPQNK